MLPQYDSAVGAPILPFVISLAKQLGARMTVMTALGEERRPGQVDDRCGAETQAVVRRQVQRMGDAEVKFSPMIGPVLRFQEIVKQA